MASIHILETDNSGIVHVVLHQAVPTLPPTAMTIQSVQ